jgi:hypothetical protein
MVYVIQWSWEQQLAAATYSASVVDWATLDYLREDQDSKEEPKNWQVSEVDFLSNRHPAKSVSEKPWSKGRSRECDASTWKFASPLADAKSSETLENKRTNIPRTGCSASSPLSRGVTRSCCGTSSGPRAHLPQCIKSCSCTHRRRHSLGVLHLELPYNVLGVLSLVSRGRTATNPSCSSQILCSYPLQTLQQES